MHSFPAWAPRLLPALGWDDALLSDALATSSSYQAPPSYHALYALLHRFSLSQRAESWQKHQSVTYLAPIHTVCPFVGWLFALVAIGLVCRDVERDGRLSTGTIASCAIVLLVVLLELGSTCWLRYAAVDRPGWPRVLARGVGAAGCCAGLQRSRPRRHAHLAVASSPGAPGEAPAASAPGRFHHQSFLSMYDARVANLAVGGGASPTPLTGFCGFVPPSVCFRHRCVSCGTCAPTTRIITCGCCSSRPACLRGVPWCCAKELAP